MFGKFRTLEQCRARYKPVTVDGSEWRVKRRRWLGIRWTFVEQDNQKIIQEVIHPSTDSLRIIFGTGPATFPTEQDAQAAIDKWAHADYTAQPAAWQ